MATKQAGETVSRSTTRTRSIKCRQLMVFHLISIFFWMRICPWMRGQARFNQFRPWKRLATSRQCVSVFRGIAFLIFVSFLLSPSHLVAGAVKNKDYQQVNDHHHGKVRTLRWTRTWKMRHMWWQGRFLLHLQGKRAQPKQMRQLQRNGTKIALNPSYSHTPNRETKNDKRTG